MPGRVKFELVSPEKILLSEEVDMVVIPGAEGNFGVLPGHSPLISAVRPGTIEVYEGSTVTQRIFTSGGFAEVTATRCTMLADEAVHLSALDRAAAETELQQADAAIPQLRQAAESGDIADVTRLKVAEKKKLVAVAKLSALDQSTVH